MIPTINYEFESLSDWKPLLGIVGRQDAVEETPPDSDPEEFSDPENDYAVFEDPPQLQLMPKRSHSTVSRTNDETDQWGADELAAKEECALTLNDPRLKDALMSRLNTFRRNRELCDVVLFVKEHEILAHKLVLASISPALFDMFLNDQDTALPSSSKSTSTANLSNGANGGSKEGSAPASSSGIGTQAVSITAGASTKQVSFYEFSQGDFECFEAIVDFAYTSKLQVTNRKVAELYKTAYCLQVFPVANACARYLAEHLSFNNCIGIRKQANFNDDEFLVAKVDSFIAENFEKVISDSQELSQLPCIKVRIIVENQQEEHTGQYLAEKCLYYFQQSPRLTERLEQQKESEKSHLLFLSEDAQLQDCCDMDDQSSVGSCEVVQDYKRAGKHTGKSSKTASIGQGQATVGAQTVQHRVTGATAVKMNASRIANAKYASNESLASLASSASTVEEEIESKLIAINNTSAGFWTVLTVLSRRLVIFSIKLSENDDISQHQKRQNSSDRVDSDPASRSHSSSKQASPERNFDYTDGQVRDIQDLPSQTKTIASSAGVIGQKRISLPNMSQARCAIGAVFLEAKIIIFGGYNRGECLSSVEEYDISKGEWRMLPEMCSERGRFDSAVVNGKVYAIAGSNGNNDLRTCECYDPKIEKWAQIKSLPKPRSHNGCATIDGMIYCIGGSSGQVVLKDCDRYDPQTDEWEPMAPMHTARFQSGCTSWRGMVVCCGGTDRWSCLDTVEAYDPRTNTWKMLAKLNTPRRGCAVAVLRDTLYVIGGHDGTQSLASVEALDHPNNQTWRSGPSLTTPRANTHAVVTAGQAAYVIGGFNNGNQFLSTVEVLENEAIGWRSWHQLGNGNAIKEEPERESNDKLSEPKRSELQNSSSTETLKSAANHNVGKAVEAK
ncbi:kelch motif domain-containing protein [Ditylenchus destructor]|uniref:Kelch motif domain-containing protein n=1 Tax=Ditylenchus destructor TaxID=166010 RepID=A0AAD4MXZ0_9BILA|nr:kelch motif domain-containing protein [Ditylenchus destructor]